LTEKSIGKLFLAGFLPGLMLTVLFMITVLIVTWFRPEAGPRAARLPMMERLNTVGRSSTLIGIVVAVLGGIYFGVFAPVEAAVGAFMTVILTIARGNLTWKATKFSVLETIKTFAFVYLILIGAFLFNPFLAVTQIPLELAGIVSGLQVAPPVILGIIVLAYIVMGTFLEGIAMLVLTIPIVFPVIKDLGYDPIWFGVLLVVVLEMSLISPPLGLNVFVVKGIAEGVPMGDIFKGVLPF
jgi:tripartite ATP-independent transporter DctM subunit